MRHGISIFVYIFPSLNASICEKFWKKLNAWEGKSPGGLRFFWFVSFLLFFSFILRYAWPKIQMQWFVFDNGRYSFYILFLFVWLALTGALQWHNWIHSGFAVRLLAFLERPCGEYADTKWMGDTNGTFTEKRITKVHVIVTTHSYNSRMPTKHECKRKCWKWKKNELSVMYVCTNR